MERFYRYIGWLASWLSSQFSCTLSFEEYSRALSIQFWTFSFLFKKTTTVSNLIWLWDDTKKTATKRKEEGNYETWSVCYYLPSIIDTSLFACLTMYKTSSDYIQINSLMVQLVSLSKCVRPIASILCVKFLYHNFCFSYSVTEMNQKKKNNEKD